MPSTTGLPLVLGDVEGLAHVVHHARHAVRGDVMRAGRRHQRRLVDRLVVELGVDRRLAGEHHHRQAGANRGRQRRHQLGHARAARDGGNGDLAGGDVVGRRRRYGGVLVPDVDGLLRPAVWQRRWTSACCRRPSGRTACRLPPQGTLLRGLRRVWAWARYLLDDEVIWYETSMPGDGQSIQLKRSDNELPAISVTA